MACVVLLVQAGWEVLSTILKTHHNRSQLADVDAYHQQHVLPRF